MTGFGATAGVAGEAGPGCPADIFDNMFGRPLAAARLRVHVRSFVYDENQTLLNSQNQFCAIGADPGQTAAKESHS